jgi:hypothetical protein
MKTSGTITPQKNVNYVEHASLLWNICSEGEAAIATPGNTKRGSITLPLTSYFTGLDYYVLHIKTKIVSCHTADSKPVTGGQWYCDTSPFSIPWLQPQI